MNYSDKAAKKVVYIFLIYYGFAFFIGSDSLTDSARYSLLLKANAALPFRDFFKVIGGLNSDTSIDIIDPLISFIVSRVTSQHSILFAVYAAIFGFFYLKSCNLLYNRYRERPRMECIGSYDIFCSYPSNNSYKWFQDVDGSVDFLLWCLSCNSLSGSEVSAYYFFCPTCSLELSSYPTQFF